MNLIVSFLMHVKAYAKINLGLRILRKREDGFHDIETVFHRINLWDDIDIEPTDGPIVMKSSIPSLPNDSKNLCWRAVESVKKELSINRGAAMLLNKHIPVGAGLGGGSSDAAAVLNALPRLWNLPLEQNRLLDIAAHLGSDVPFFLHNGSAYAEGRGEKLFYVELKFPYWILVVYPDIHIATAWAYRELSERMTTEGGKKISVAKRSPPKHDIHEFLNTMENDFENIVFPAFPKVKALKHGLLSRGAKYALLSGSGSSVFGLFENESDARHAFKIFQSDNFVSLTEPNFTPPC